MASELLLSIRVKWENMTNCRFCRGNQTECLRWYRYCLPGAQGASGLDLSHCTFNLFVTTRLWYLLDIFFIQFCYLTLFLTTLRLISMTHRYPEYQAFFNFSKGRSAKEKPDTDAFIVAFHPLTVWLASLNVSTNQIHFRWSLELPCIKERASYRNGRKSGK